MDVVLDLWINAVYADDRVQGSVVGPVVYMRNGSGNPRVSYEVLAKRWNVSKATIGRYFKKLVALGYISLTTFPEKQGIVIYLENCLSTMFRVSDILLDKEEIVMQLKTKITLDDSVVTADISASTQCIDKVIKKLENILVAHGYSCVDCRALEYKLSKLPESEELLAMHSSSKSRAKLRYHLVLSCSSDKPIMVVELTFRPVIQSKGGIVNDSQEQS